MSDFPPIASLRSFEAVARPGCVMLAMVPSFGCHWLLPQLARFRAKYPLITLRIQASACSRKG